MIRYGKIILELAIRIQEVSRNVTSRSGSSYERRGYEYDLLWTRPEVDDYLREMWRNVQEALTNGLQGEGSLPSLWSTQ